MYDKLTLMWDASERLTGGGDRYLHLRLLPKINGLSPGGSPVFSARTFMAQGAMNGHFPIFVCQCGDEGCLGPDTGSQLICEDTAVQWELDEKFFRAAFDPSFSTAHTRMKFSFIRSEYESVVENSLTEAAAIERGASLPVSYDEGPVHHISELEGSIVQRIGRERAYIKRYLDDRSAWKVKFGRLFGATLDVRLNGAEVFKFSIPDLITAASAANRTIQDRDTFISNVVGASSEDCLALLSAIVKDGPWSEICLYGWLEVDGACVEVDEPTLAAIGTSASQVAPTITYNRSN